MKEEKRMVTDPTILAKLEELLGAIKGYEDPRRASTEWKQVYKLLQKTELRTNRVANVVAMRGVDQLVKLIDELGAPPPEVPPEVGADKPDSETCKRAMQAFRKRLKFTILDDESKIDSRNPLTSGRGSQIKAIIPPFEWPREVWEELAAQGKLRNVGRGFYELVE